MKDEQDPQQLEYDYLEVLSLLREMYNEPELTRRHREILRRVFELFNESPEPRAN